jgi:hypothetical protein
MLNEKTHGPFHETSVMSQNLKDVMRTGKTWKDMTDPQIEALEFIAVHLARILTGDKDHREHWQGLSEFAQLASQSSPSTMPNVTFDLQQAMSGIKD